MATYLEVPITADITRDTYDKTNNFSKVLFQIGKPLIDAELNEFQDNLLTSVRSFMSAFGSFVLEDGFKVSESISDNVNNFTVELGDAFVGGVFGNLEANIEYVNQVSSYGYVRKFWWNDDVSVPVLTTPSGSDRTDLVVLNFVLRELTATEDPNIKDPSLDRETARRIKLDIGITVLQNYTDPIANFEDRFTYENSAYVFRVPLAYLNRVDGDSRILSSMISDQRSTLLQLISSDSDKVDGRDVDDNGTSTDVLWTASKILSEIRNRDSQDSVKGFHDASSALPGSPSIGDRWICSVAGNGWLVDHIYEYEGSSSWVDITPNKGFLTYNEDDDLIYLYNGSSWSDLGTYLGVVITHSGLSGVSIAVPGSDNTIAKHITDEKIGELDIDSDIFVVKSGETINKDDIVALNVDVEAVRMGTSEIDSQWTSSAYSRVTGGSTLTEVFTLSNNSVVMVFASDTDDDGYWILLDKSGSVIKSLSILGTAGKYGDTNNFKVIELSSGNFMIAYGEGGLALTFEIYNSSGVLQAGPTTVDSGGSTGLFFDVCRLSDRVCFYFMIDGTNVKYREYNFSGTALISAVAILGDINGHGIYCTPGYDGSVALVHFDEYFIVVQVSSGGTKNYQKVTSNYPTIVTNQSDSIYTVHDILLFKGITMYEDSIVCSMLYTFSYSGLYRSFYVVAKLKINDNDGGVIWSDARVLKEIYHATATPTYKDSYNGFNVRFSGDGRYMIISNGLGVHSVQSYQTGHHPIIDLSNLQVVSVVNYFQSTIGCSNCVAFFPFGTSIAYSYIITSTSEAQVKVVKKLDVIGIAKKDASGGNVEVFNNQVIKTGETSLNVGKMYSCGASGGISAYNTNYAVLGIALGISRIKLLKWPHGNLISYKKFDW